jgi:hypothetical protein
MMQREMHYYNNGYAMKTIVAMAMGLKKEDEDMMHVNTTKDPWLTKVTPKIGPLVGAPVLALIDLTVTFSHTLPILS